MQIKANELERYRKAMEDARDSAESWTKTRVLSECAGLSVSEARETAISIITDTAAAFGERAQAASCQLFEEICEAEGIKTAEPLTYDDLTDGDDIRRKVGYFARDLTATGRGLSVFAEACAERAGFYVWREGNLCQARNVENA